jgi:pfkB family carbohydrate kinase
VVITAGPDGAHAFSLAALPPTGQSPPAAVPSPPVTAGGGGGDGGSGNGGGDSDSGSSGGDDGGGDGSNSGGGGALVSWHQRSRAVEVVDTTGAGDAFAAGFLYTWKVSTLYRISRDWQCFQGKMMKSLLRRVVCGNSHVRRVL